MLHLHGSASLLAAAQDEQENEERTTAATAATIHKIQTRFTTKKRQSPRKKKSHVFSGKTQARPNHRLHRKKTKKSRENKKTAQIRVSKKRKRKQRAATIRNENAPLKRERDVACTYMLHSITRPSPIATELTTAPERSKHAKKKTKIQQ